MERDSQSQRVVREEQAERDRESICKDQGREKQRTRKKRTQRMRQGDRHRLTLKAKHTGGRGSRDPQRQRQAGRRDSGRQTLE